MELIFKVVVVVFTTLLIITFLHGILLWIQEWKVIREERAQWKKGDALPLSVVQATVVTKRVQESLQTRVHGKSTTFISYRVTFEFENGEHKELSIGFHEYNLIAEGDIVQLSFQGKKYRTLEKRGG